MSNNSILLYLPNCHSKEDIENRVKEFLNIMSFRDGKCEPDNMRAIDTDKNNEYTGFEFDTFDSNIDSICEVFKSVYKEGFWKNID